MAALWKYPGSVVRPLAGRLTDRVLSRWAEQRTAQLDHLDVGECQRRTLLGLVRQARHTRFGRDHAFDRIHSVADYQRQVPLRSYEGFWDDYWQSAFPCLENVSWPGRIPYLALSSGTTSGSTKYLPVSAQMLRSNRRAALTTLALFLRAFPNTPLFCGQLFFLGGSTALADLGQGVWSGDLSGIASETASAWMRPFVFPPLQLALEADWDRKLDILARQGAAAPITMLSGVPSWLLALFERLREVTRRETIAEVWPRLRLLLHGGTRFDPYHRLFRERIGSNDVHFLETYPASEGYIAAEDLRHGLLRLLPDHGIFFEFVPLEELETNCPTRHTLSCIERGVPYALVLTTCAGLWSYVLGDVVCFEQCRPPLLRFLGRTRQMLSAFGEHLIGEEIEQAVAAAAAAVQADVVDFHVGPLFPAQVGGPGCHHYLVEFAAEVTAEQQAQFVQALDQHLAAANEDYAAHRQGDLALAAPRLQVVRRGGFADWLRARGQLGGQHKVPRLDGSGERTAALALFFQSGPAGKARHAG